MTLLLPTVYQTGKLVFGIWPKYRLFSHCLSVELGLREHRLNYLAVNKMTLLPVASSFGPNAQRMFSSMINARCNNLIIQTSNLEKCEF